MDFAGHTQTAAFSSGFTTGASSDITNGSVAPSYIPEGNSTNVALNIQPTFFFTKQVNPISIYPGIFVLTNANTGAIIPSTTTVAANQLSVTLTPLSNLQPETRYNLNLSTVYDVAGNYISGTGITFTTGAAATSTGASVVSIAPANNMTGVPLNTVIVAVMSAPVSQNTFGNSPITVKAGANVVAGTTTLASDEETFTFTPAANLSASTVYTVTVGGFDDRNGNAVQSSTTSFITGTTTDGSGTFAVSSTTPANNTTLSSNTTQIVLTFNQAVDPSTITNVLVRDESESYDEIAGSWSVNGAVATFTPLSPYPANHIIQVYVLTIPAGELNAGDEFYFQSQNALDITGNNAGIPYQYGFVGTTNDATAPP